VFAERDSTHGVPVIMINQAFARKYFPDENPVGKRIRFDEGMSWTQWEEIVGVAGDVKEYGLEHPVGDEVYGVLRNGFVNRLIVRTTLDPTVMAQAIRADELEERLSEMLRAQSEATGRVDAMGQALAGRQADMARAVNERLDSVTHRVGQSMEQTTRNTMDSLRVLHERLGIIDNAHKNLTDLTSQVTTLRDVLANKQSRGAFGQARMEAIVQDGMPKGS